jgi:hypothetical protein
MGTVQDIFVAQERGEPMVALGEVKLRSLAGAQAAAESATPQGDGRGMKMLKKKNETSG